MLTAQPSPQAAHFAYGQSTGLSVLRLSAANAPSSSIQRFGADIVSVEQSMRVELIEDCIDFILRGLD